MSKNYGWDNQGCVAKPCNDCPWRRNAKAGWLGPHSADKWTQIVHSDTPIACHKTLAGSSWEGASQCRGAAIFRANVSKHPRDPNVEVGPKDHEQVFSNDDEFKDYHDGL